MEDNKLTRQEYYDKWVQPLNAEYTITSITKYKDVGDSTYIMHSKKATVIFVAKKTEKGGTYTHVVKARNHVSHKAERAQRFLMKYIRLVCEIGFYVATYGADDEQN